MYKKILIIADIEGSTGCANYKASSFNTKLWYDACIDMSIDINSVVKKLFESGVEKIYVKDFHRTGYNLLPELIDKRALIIHGYKKGPVLGIGSVYDAEAAMFIGMHASSGSEGFLAHTFTSRYSSMMLNKRRVSELQLFASSLYRYSIKPIFFSGCPIACNEAIEDIQSISVFPIIKDKFGKVESDICVLQLTDAVANSLKNDSVKPYILEPPYNVEIRMRDGEKEAKKVSNRWKIKQKEETVLYASKSFDEFYEKLIDITYLTPALKKITPIALFLFNLYGRFGLAIVRFMRRGKIKKLKLLQI
jgi:D-aminopeptidase